VRYDGNGDVVEAQAIAGKAGWWRAAVRVSARTADGRRWVLLGAVRVPGRGSVDRIEVGESPYVVPGVELPQAGQTSTVMGRDRTVHALLTGGGQ
jgi:hypothetical protein